MFLNYVLPALAVLSVLLLLWQWSAGVRFRVQPLLGGTSYTSPQSTPSNTPPISFGGTSYTSPQSTLRPAPFHAPAPLPPVTILKPLKGCDDQTEKCLRSWFVQDYPARIQILFGIADDTDPVAALVRALIKQFPSVNAALVICQPLVGANAKVAKLAVLEKLAAHETLVISDADVWIEPRFLSRLLGPLADDPSIGLVNCFYELAGPTSLAMKWEALAINADFWSQVLQSKDLKPLDFALGAVMATRKTQVRDIGGFEAIADCLADDYQLGNRIARGGHRIDLQPLVARCFSAPMGWRAVWKHQLRWARTIRVCQPVPYFFSILSNPALWPLLWALTSRSTVALGFLAAAAVIRVVSAADLQKRLAGNWPSWHTLWLASLKDLAQVALWFLAFSGNTVEWRGRKMRLDRDGKLVPNTELGTSNIEL